MAQQPGVVIIARHGPRLDAADQQWHLSTPTPYDPPLTYAGWNQCRALGIRIASLLHAREEESAPSEAVKTVDGVTIHDFAQQKPEGVRKRKRKHNVVIHSSPFLRCLQTSVAIAAGMAQFQPPSEASTSRPSTSGSSTRSRTPNSYYSHSPRLRAADSPTSPTLPAIVEPKHDLAHLVARKALSEHRRHRRSKLRIDAFLGEWLNPPYFDQITPPPPSPMMVATAKAELMQNETVDIFTPSVTSKSSQGSLWGSNRKPPSRQNSLDEWSGIQDAVSPTSPARSRANSATSANSSEGGSGARSPRLAHHHAYLHAVHPLTSTVPKPETTVYVPPTPHYAVSGHDPIPRGYVSHARNACVNVDYQWDSSRPPQNWPDGGEYGEEWSAMHKRFRRGLNHLINWYSQHNADDRAEDSLGLDQAEKHEEEEQEELVLILVTHGAGSNALIGALTGQPVLLDVGMASLTMAVRRDDAPPLIPGSAGTSPRTSPTPLEMWNGHHMHARRGSLDLGLSSVYEMKLVSSSEHLRPGADPTKLPSISRQTSPTVAALSAASGMPFRQRFTVSGADAAADHKLPASLGSAVRRPSIQQPGVLGRTNTAPAVPQIKKYNKDEREERKASPPLPSFTGGLWTPPSGRTPILAAQEQLRERNFLVSEHSPVRAMLLTPESRPASSSSSAGAVGETNTEEQAPATHQPPEPRKRSAMAAALNGTLDGAATSAAQADSGAGNGSAEGHRGREASISSLSAVGQQVPSSLSRGLSQKGLWGSRPRGAKVERKFPPPGREPKRRWTQGTPGAGLEVEEK
jgi:broad specificity phosphatase PhoE